MGAQSLRLSPGGAFGATILAERVLKLRYAALKPTKVAYYTGTSSHGQIYLIKALSFIDEQFMGDRNPASICLKTCRPPGTLTLGLSPITSLSNFGEQDIAQKE